MTQTEKPLDRDSLRKQHQRLTMIGIIVLVLGLGSAGLVFWLGNRSQDSTDDLDMVGYNRAESRQMGVLFGRMGLVIDDLQDDLKRPGTQAAIIAVVSTLIASACFYLGRPLDNGDETR